MKPKRTYELALTIGADTLDDLRSNLRSISIELDRRDDLTDYSSVSGGYQSNHILKIEYSSAVTHDSYFEELDKHLTETRRHE